MKMRWSASQLLGLSAVLLLTSLPLTSSALNPSALCSGLGAFSVSRSLNSSATRPLSASLPSLADGAFIASAARTLRCFPQRSSISLRRYQEHGENIVMSSKRSMVGEHQVDEDEPLLSKMNLNLDRRVVLGGIAGLVVPHGQSEDAAPENPPQAEVVAVQGSALRLDRNTVQLGAYDLEAELSFWTRALGMTLTADLERMVLNYVNVENPSESKVPGICIEVFENQENIEREMLEIEMPFRPSLIEEIQKSGGRVKSGAGFLGSKKLDVASPSGHRVCIRWSYDAFNGYPRFLGSWA